MTNLFLVTWCPGQTPPAPCDPCAQVTGNAFLQATDYMFNPATGQNDPYTGAVDPNQNFVNYTGQTFGVTIVFAVQNVKVTVGGLTPPLYGYQRANINIPFPKRPINIDLHGSLVVTAAVSNGWDVTFMPTVVFS
jgi:hypothetical protein